MKGVLLLTLMVFNLPCLADGDKFALIAKSIDDPNFVDTWVGCQEEAQKFGDECSLLGGVGPVSPHAQYNAIEDAIRSNQYAAIAISVTKSEFIANALTDSNIPVLTYDSPLSDKTAHLSLGYIGPNNEAFGVDLGEAVKAIRPQGGVVCIITASHDPNLQQRVVGVRQSLSRLENRTHKERLAGENGWIESNRCPFITGVGHRQTMDQLEAALTVLDVDVVISVGHWPIDNPNQYRKTVSPYALKLKNNKVVIVIAVGKVQPSYTELLNDGLIHGLVSIDFKEIGRLTYLRMREAHLKIDIPVITQVKNTTLMSGKKVN